jgi:hypothetical protein
VSKKARERQDLDDRENFIRARDNETEVRYLDTGWTVFRDFDVEKTEYGAHLRAKWRDPGLPRPRKLSDGSEGKRYSAEWLSKDDNAARDYAPLRDEPDLFLRFASLADQDPGIEDRDGRLEITEKWIKTYGVLGLVYENGSTHELVNGWKSVRRENLLLFWEEVHRAADCLTAFRAGTAPARMLKHSNIPGKTTMEKRKSAAQTLASQLNWKLEHECYPKFYYGVLRDTGEPAKVWLSLGFRSLLGAMYLQLAWRIKSRQCQAPGCNNIIGLDRRSDAETCSQRCKERRRYHHDRVADKRPATSRSATTSLD